MTLIKNLKNRLKVFLEIEDNEIIISQKQDNTILIKSKSKALSQIEIINYKKLVNLKIENLNRVNIFAGVNNSGKTSLLEAITL